MTNKPAALSADLVAVKGAATPSPDMSGRAGPAPSPASPSPPAEPATVATPRAKASQPTRRPTAAAKPEETEANLAPLNFRTSASFRREFKTYAARHDLKLNELLRLCFEAYRRQQRD